MKAKDLKEDPKNPRTMSDKQLRALEKSMKKYGDLSGFVYDRRTKTLIGGHQKKKKVPPDSKIEIVKKYDKPNEQFTVAVGWLHVGDEAYKYREVQSPNDAWARGANIAANKHSGKWDNDKLKISLADIKTDIDVDDIEIMGFDDEEDDLDDLGLGDLGDEVDEDDDDDENEESESGEKVGDVDVDNSAKSGSDKPNGNSSQEAQKPGLEDAQEQTSVANKQFVIIVKCPSQEAKDALRNKIEPLVKEAQAKIF